MRVNDTARKRAGGNKQSVQLLIQKAIVHHEEKYKKDGTAPVP